LKAIILEDNVLTSWDYEMVLDALGIQVIGTYKSWKQALPIIKNGLPDLMIIDLYLEHNEKGLDFIKTMRDYFIPTIICTAYTNESYMEQALENGVAAFIKKPIDKSLLTFQVKRIIRGIELQNFHKNFLIVKENRNYIKIPFANITMIETEGNYSFIHLDSGKKYVEKLSLIKLREKLDSEIFIRCYRSTIVNLQFIVSLDLEENILKLKNGTSLNVGVRYRSAVKKAFTGD